MKNLSDEELIAHLRLQGLDKDVAAADRIEQLIEARNKMGNLWANEKEAKHNAEAKLAKAMKLIGFAIELARFDSNPKLLDDMIYFKTEYELEKTE